MIKQHYIGSTFLIKALLLASFLDNGKKRHKYQLIFAVIRTDLNRFQHGILEQQKYHMPFVLQGLIFRT
jgi:hypothetical protein